MGTQRRILERPPAVGDAEHDVEPPRPARDLLQHEQASRRQQALQVAQRARHVRRAVHHVGADDDVVRARLQALLAGVAGHVEGLVADPLAELLAGQVHEQGRHVREGEARTLLRQPRQHVPRGAARARADLEHAQLAAVRERRQRGRHRLGGERVEQPARRRLAIEGGHRLQAVPREQNVRTVTPPGQHVGERLAAAREQVDHAAPAGTLRAKRFDERERIVRGRHTHDTEGVALRRQHAGVRERCAERVELAPARFRQGRAVRAERPSGAWRPPLARSRENPARARRRRARCARAPAPRHGSSRRSPARRSGDPPRARRRRRRTRARTRARR